MNDYQQMAKVINYLSDHPKQRPSLALLANMAGLSPSHFQRKFTAWVGISPKSHPQCLTLKDARGQLSRGNNVLDASLDSGLSSPGRLHDLCVTLEAATPGEIKSGGEGLEIGYGFGPTPFGECILANSRRGICYLAFIDDGEHELAIRELKNTWPKATLTHQKQDSLKLIKEIFNPGKNIRNPSLRAFVKGTKFQLRVWRALLKIPEGRLLSYGKLAKQINYPGAARATGTAVAKNSLAYLVPCHRVIRNSGVIGDYRWGSERKKAIIACESARSIII